MDNRGEVLVSIINTLNDLQIAREKHWYRIPVASVSKFLEKRWPPQWIAFYQTKVFGEEAHAVNYYAQVRQIQEVYRWQLFPGAVNDAKSDQRYYQLILGFLHKLPQPIISPRWRRIVFIPTTWEKFIWATEVNDLYDESPLEDHLWAYFKRWEIITERQAYITIKQRYYILDFAIYCAQGKLDVETDGDSWHANPARAAADNRRDNALETAGWRVLRFNTKQISEETEDYCLPTIMENINKLGGLDEGTTTPRKITPSLPPGSRQLGLFDLEQG